MCTAGLAGPLLTAPPLAAGGGMGRGVATGRGACALPPDAADVVATVEVDVVVVRPVEVAPRGATAGLGSTVIVAPAAAGGLEPTLADPVVAVAGADDTGDGPDLVAGAAAVGLGPIEPLEVAVAGLEPAGLANAAAATAAGAPTTGFPAPVAGALVAGGGTTAEPGFTLGLTGAGVDTDLAVVLFVAAVTVLAAVLFVAAVDVVVGVLSADDAVDAPVATAGPFGTGAVLALLCALRRNDVAVAASFARSTAAGSAATPRTAPPLPLLPLLPPRLPDTPEAALPPPLPPPLPVGWMDAGAATTGGGGGAAGAATVGFAATAAAFLPTDAPPTLCLPRASTSRSSSSSCSDSASDVVLSLSLPGRDGAAAVAAAPPALPFFLFLPFFFFFLPPAAPAPTASSPSPSPSATPPAAAAAAAAAAFFALFFDCTFTGSSSSTSNDSVNASATAFCHMRDSRKTWVRSRARSRVSSRLPPQCARYRDGVLAATSSSRSCRNHTSSCHECTDVMNCLMACSRVL